MGYGTMTMLLSHITKTACMPADLLCAGLPRIRVMMTEMIC